MAEQPSAMDEKSRPLADELRANRERLLESWESRTREFERARGLDSHALLDPISELLESLAETAEETPSGAEAPRLSAHAPHHHAQERMREGFTLEEVVAEYTLLRACLLEHLEGQAGWWGNGGLRVLHQALDQALSVAVSTYAHARERPLRILDRVAEASLRSGGTEEFLHQLLGILVEAVAPVDFALVLLREGDSLRLRTTLGLDEPLAAEFSARIGEDFVGRVAAGRRPIFLRSAATDPLLSSHALRAAGLRALYGLPLLQEGRIVGVLLAGSRTAFDFTQEDQELFRIAADRASVLLRQMQLAEREREARTQAALAQGRHQDLMEGIDTGIAWEADAHTYQPCSVSPRAEALLGYSLTEWLETPDFWVHYLHPQDREHVLATFAQVLAGKGARTCEHRMRARDGREVWLRTSVRTSRPIEGAPQMLLGLSVDITGLKDVESALRVRERGQEHLTALGRHALEGASLAELIREAMERVAQVFDVEFSELLEPVPEQEWVRLRDGVGWKRGVDGRATEYGGATSQAGHLLRTRQPLILEDLRTETRFVGAPRLHEHGVISGLCVLVHDEEEPPYGLLGVYTCRRRTFTPQDVTLLQAMANILAAAMVRTRAEARLRESEEFFRRLVAGVEDYAIFRLDTHGYIVSWNAGAERLLGWRGEEVLGQHFGLFYPEEERARGDPLRHLNQALAKGRCGHDTWRVRKDGSPFWATDLLVPLRGEDGALGGFTKVTRDISEQRRGADRQRFLVQASSLFAQSLDHDTTVRNLLGLVVPYLADGCLIDLEGQEHQRELGAAHVDGAKAELLKRLQRHYPGGSHPDSPRARVWRSGRTELLPVMRDVDLQRLAVDEEHLRLLRAVAPHAALVVPLPARGRILGTLLLLATEPGRGFGSAEQDLAEALARRAAYALDNASLYWKAQEAVRARDEFLSIASHELRTPLTSMHLQMQMLLRAAHRARAESPAIEALADRLEAVERQEKRLAKLVDHLLDISRITTGRLGLELETVDLADVVRGVAARFEEDLRQAGCELRLSAPTQLLGCWDRVRMEEVVTNLLSNAVKYGAGRPIELTLEAQNGWIRLRVRDQGMGISPEDHVRIFERFQRVSRSAQGGLGLGLWIVRAIVEAMRGTVRVESTLGAGAAFTVELPRG
jgi:PAS domain S-box-containing protein